MADPNPISAKSIDEYIARQPERFRASLEELRSIIKSIVPEAKESISYQVPCFKYIYMLVGIGVTKEFCSLYVMSPSLVKELKAELEGFRFSGATLHFPLQQPLPVALIRKIVKARVKENKEKSLSKN